MSLLDELQAAYTHLDYILGKLATADPADKQKLEAIARAAQAKAQEILLAVQATL